MPAAAPELSVVMPVCNERAAVGADGVELVRVDDGSTDGTRELLRNGNWLAPVAAGEADAAFGIRGFRAHSAHSFWYVAGNRVVALAASHFSTAGSRAS